MTRLGTGLGPASFASMGRRGAPRPDEALSTLTITPSTFATDESAAVLFTAKDAGNVAMADVGVLLSAQVVEIDLERCVLTADATVVDADGTAFVTLFIALKQTRRGSDGEPLPVVNLPASFVTISATGTGNTLTQPSARTNSSGTTTAEFRTTVVGVKTITALVDGVAIPGTVTIEAGGEIVDPEPASAFFTDTFEGGVKNNANGFSWNGTGSRVSVVSFDGRDCLRFRYGPDDATKDSTAEQRFNMGRSLQELWLEYWIHIPANFSIRADFPANNKFLALWPNNYSTVGETYVVAEFERDGTDSSRARIIAYADPFYTDGTSIRSGDAILTSPFLSAALRGTWNRVRVHYKIASGPGMTDGIYEFWLNDTLMARSRSDYSIYSTGGQNFIRNGYFMGWANSGYTDVTDFHISGGVDGPKFYQDNPGWTFS